MLLKDYYLRVKELEIKEQMANNDTMNTATNRMNANAGWMNALTNQRNSITQFKEYLLRQLETNQRMFIDRETLDLLLKKLQSEIDANNSTAVSGITNAASNFVGTSIGVK